jgi:hypothetical protein
VSFWDHVAYSRKERKAHQAALLEFEEERARRLEARDVAQRELDAANAAVAGKEGDELLEAVQHLRACEQRQRVADTDVRLSPAHAVPPNPRWLDGRGDFKLRYTIPAWLFGVALGVTLLIVTIAFTVRNIDHYYASRACAPKGEVLQVETRFADYTFWEFKCLANVAGRWVPVDTVNRDTGVWLRGDDQR